MKIKSFAAGIVAVLLASLGCVPALACPVSGRNSSKKIRARTQLSEAAGRH